MYAIDLRTVYLNYIVIQIVNLLIILFLHIQVKKRFPETKLILFSYVLNTVGNILVYCRGGISDWISIIFANTLIIFSILLLLFAFERFINKKSFQLYSYALIFIFFCGNYYFTFVQVDLGLRIINLSVIYILITSQIAWLLLVRAPEKVRSITLPVGIVFLVIVVSQIFRVLFVVDRYYLTTNYFNSNYAESQLLLLYGMLLIFMTFSLFLMYNKRLMLDALAQEEKFYRVFQTAPFIIVLSKFPSGIIFEVNNTFSRVTGLSSSQVVELKSGGFCFWKNKEDEESFLEEVNNKGNVKQQEYEFNIKNGKQLTGLVSAELITINNEICLVSVISDITKRKNTELEIIKRKEELKELNATKDKFFSIIAHDLKSPFNGILGFSQLLNDKVIGKQYEKVQEYAQIIYESSQRAMDLLSNLLEWSKAQTGKLQFNPKKINFTTLAISIVDLLSISARQKSIKMEVLLQDSLIIIADEHMVNTVLRNLISNAIKFTPRKGKITISAEQNDQNLVIIIKDTGVGIPTSNLKKMFEIDGGISTPGTEKEKGTGLGLILCKDFIEKHNGKIWVESEVGVGSSFYFTIPKGKIHFSVSNFEEQVNI